MTTTKILKTYPLSDGLVDSMQIQYDLKRVVIAYTGTKNIGKGKSVKCQINITLFNVREMQWYDVFPRTHCTDVTLYTLESGEIYLSFDPYGNTGKPHLEDNEVIIAESIEVSEVDILNLSLP